MDQKCPEMEFITSTFIKKTSLLTQHPYHWLQDFERPEVYYLYQNNEEVAKLSLQEGLNTPPYFIHQQKTVDIIDESTFFKPNLTLIEKETGIRIGAISKKESKQEEGTIQYLGQTYGWKLNTRPHPNFMLMDQKRKKLFSYHYRPRHIRLLLNHTCPAEHPIIPLLCIGLLLLPVWYR